MAEPITKIAQSAPVMPPPKGVEEYLYLRVKPPLSATTSPSVYNKKLNNLFRGRLAVLHGEATISDALTRMARFNISSFPVTKSKKDSTILGFVDVLDILTYLCKMIGKETAEEKFEIDQQQLKEKTESFKKTKVDKLVDMSGLNPFYSLHGEDSLIDAVEQYLKGVQRIAITDDDGDLIGVISQWTIANYLATVSTDDKDCIRTLKYPVGESKYDHKVNCVNGKETALNSFLKMNELKQTSLAVVDNEGILVGNLSASDLKGFQLFLHEFNDLLHPVSEFLSIIRKKQGRNEKYAVAVTESTTIYEIMCLFNQEIVHRVYIVDNQYKPIGVFSLTHLMQMLITDTHVFGRVRPEER